MFVFFIHAFESILGKYTVWSYTEEILLQTLSISQHKNWHILYVTVLSVQYFWQSKWI